MKIQREINGEIREFELSSDELWNAFLEQEHKFDRNDVLSKLEDCKDAPENARDFLEYYGVSYTDVLNNDDLINALAKEKRHNQDKHGMEWEHAREEAFKDVLSDYKLDLLGLPERCYGILRSTNEIIIIARGESGYYKADLSSDDPQLNKRIVNDYNEKIGVSKAQAAAMLAGSMFGWGVPAADPAAYDETGALKKSVDRPSLDSIIDSARDSREEFNKGQLDVGEHTHSEVMNHSDRSER